jgi:hypothetical protein
MGCNNNEEDKCIIYIFKSESLFAINNRINEKMCNLI